jgi:phenylpyruvate tautomerase PptA (4-oxalocrotonate tautomerase family)
MPTLRLAIPPNAWTKEEKAELIKALTDALADTAKRLEKGDIRPFIGVQIDETAEGGYAIGGQVFG